jgi:hypothetical protein
VTDHDPPDWVTLHPYGTPSRSTSWVATRKVSAVTVTAGAVTVIAGIIDLFQIAVPASLAAVLTGLLSSGMAYLIPESGSDRPGQHRKRE